ncbi:hypothetical protein [Mycobacterium sp. 1465703.0]|uniref:CDGP domain-containing protein n=1 Tax=Mycobacterium sp. 1465703.0 TaxID=1834078 RepID=UPI0007FC9FE2|nr:hypothetical protein [Mycobacterium sp. 1465703.0]OBI95582.1 hypothetical protein A5625_08185 [Mycobacterium sp. 1465703.0]
MSTKTTIIAAISGALVAGALAAAGPAHAAPDPSVGPNCDTVPWGFLFSQRRTICDGPVHADGSWDRKRSIWTPAHTVPITTNCYGSSYVTCTTTGGQFVPFTINDQQIYPVTPENVLPDEPGHLG